MTEHARTALIVGASRGLGLGLVQVYLDRGWRVVATTRGQNDDGLRALAATAGARLAVRTLDVTDAAAIETLRRERSTAPLDLLFVSAGVNNNAEQTAGSVPAEVFDWVMQTNALAPLKVIEALGQGVASDGAIVAMTSVLGSVAQNGSGGYEVYRASKAALNTLLRSYGARHPERSLIAMHPGWVRTDMGGSNAMLSVSDSAKGMANVIEARLGVPGCVFLDWQGKTIAW